MKNSPIEKKKSAMIGVRITSRLQERLDGAAEMTGIKPASLANACLEALANYFEREHELTFPLYVISKADFEKLQKLKERERFES